MVAGPLLRVAVDEGLSRTHGTFFRLFWFNKIMMGLKITGHQSSVTWLYNIATFSLIPPYFKAKQIQGGDCLFFFQIEIRNQVEVKELDTQWQTTSGESIWPQLWRLSGFICMSCRARASCPWSTTVKGGAIFSSTPPPPPQHDHRMFYPDWIWSSLQQTQWPLIAAAVSLKDADYTAIITHFT